MNILRSVAVSFGAVIFLAACGTSAEWGAFDDPDYSIEFPGKPEVGTSSAQGISFEIQAARHSDVVYSAAKFGTPHFDLVGGLNGAFSDGLATTPSIVEDVVVDGHSCKKGFGTGTGQSAHVQNTILVCYDGATAYILQVISERGKEVDPDRFLHSFSIKAQ